MANEIVRLSNRGLAWKGASTVTDALKAFQVSRGSADYDLSADRQLIGYRARALYQNSSFAGALINSIDTNVIGTGLKCRPAIPWEQMGMSREQALEWERNVQVLFGLWAGSKKCDAENKCDFHELQDLALKTQYITGDCFALAQYKSEGNAFGLRLKLMEGDRVQNPFGIMESERLSQGVEVDSVGSPVAYHFTRRPPYNLDTFTNAVETVRIPAFDAFGNVNVIHCFTVDRTDQRRGISALAPIISQIKQQERYQDAELLAAVVSAMFTVFLESNDPDDAGGFDVGNVPEEQRVSDDVGPSAPIEMAPGAIVELPNGYKANPANPNRPNVNYKPFVDSIFCECAARLGISYEVVLKQFNSSYNAVRAALLESKKTFNRIKHNFVSDFCQPVYEKWLTHAVLTGAVKATGFDDPLKRSMWSRCDWIGDAAFLLDPTKETQAIKMQVDEQFMSRSAAVAAITGGEYDRVAHELSEEKKLRESLGLAEPGAVNKSESVSVATVEDGDKKENENGEK